LTIGEHGVDLAGYGRVSGEAQKDRATIRAQVRAGEEWAEKNGHKIVRWYLDDPEHSYVPLPDRKEGGKLLADARLGLWRGVVVYELDRWGRKPSVIYTALDVLYEYDIQFFQVGSESDILSSEGELTFGIKASVARYDHRRLLKKMVDGRNTVVEDGAWPGGILPYGYDKELRRKRWYPIPNEMPIVGCEHWTEAGVIRAIYRWCVCDGFTGKSIARRLTQEGIPTHMNLQGRGNRKEVLSKADDRPSSGIWHPTRVREILANPMYKGVHVFGQQSKKKAPPRIERAVPPLVSVEMWEAAQVQLAANKTNSKRNAKQDYLLARKLHCVHCGRGFTGTQRPNGHILKAGWAYVCNRKKNDYYRKDIPACPLRPLREWVEASVWERVEWALRNPGDLVQELREQLGEQQGQRAEWEDNRSRLMKSLSGLETRKDRAEEAYLAGVMELDRYQAQLRRVKEEAADMNAEVAVISAQLAGLDDQERQAGVAEDVLKEVREELDEGMSWEAKRGVIERIVERVEITPPAIDGAGPRIHVVLRFAAAQEPFDNATRRSIVVKCSLTVLTA
jgi:site-specific DNA recombinase